MAAGEGSVSQPIFVEIFTFGFAEMTRKAFMNIFMLQCLCSDLNACFHLGSCLGRMFFDAVGVPLKSDLGTDFFISDCPESPEAGTSTTETVILAF